MARRCTCGNTEFYRVSGGQDVEADVEFWVQADDSLLTTQRVGHGVTPQGTLHGSGDEVPVATEGSYALIRSPYVSRDTSQRCTACDRIRVAANQGGIALFGTYHDALAETYCFVTHSTESFANYRARVIGQVQPVDVLLPLFVDAGPAQPAETVNLVLQTSAILPPGQELAPGLLCADISSIVLADTYDVRFVDAPRGLEVNANSFTVA